MYFFLDAQPAQASQGQVGQGFEQTFIMLAIALIFFYFILWRPEQKKKKQVEELRAGMKKGDRAMVAGIVGEVVKVNADTVILKMVEGAKIEVLKAAIYDVQPRANSDKAEEKTAE